MTPEAKEDHLKATVQQLSNDPNASEDVKSMAGKVSQQIDNDRLERQFAAGN